MEDSDEPYECVDAEMVIEDAYQKHVVEFREFAEKANVWLNTYEQTMAPKILACLEEMGQSAADANWKLLADLTSHAEAFPVLIQQALAEYEEAYKTARAIFSKVK